MPKFVSGDLRIDIKYNDRTSQYQAKVCAVDKSERCEKVFVRNPGGGARNVHGKRIAVDDPRAYRDAAHAAISFSNNDLQSLAASNRRGSGWLVKPPKRRRKR